MVVGDESSIEPHAPAPLLVGRAREQAALDARLEAALAGRGSLALISGEAGIGKTALAEAVNRQATARGALALIGHCYDLTETPPYGPWTDLFDRLLTTPDLPELPADLLQPGDGPYRTSQLALFAQVREFLTTLAARRPLLLVLDDLHWTDPASLELLRFLGRQIATLPVLIIATYRGDELTRYHPLYTFLPLLIRETDPLRLDLRRLEPEATRALIRARYALAWGDEVRLVAYLQQHAEGNPLYIGEVLRTLEEEGSLFDTSGGWVLRDLTRVIVPALLRQVIERRVARLSEASRDLLVQAAVIGQEVPLDLWATVSAVDEEMILAAVERAAEARLLEEEPDGQRVRFCHALIREALYQGISPARRRGWHRRVSEALLATHAPDPDALAFHFLQAGDPRATSWLIKAGERAYQTYAWLSAAERFEAALVLLDATDADPAERGRLLFRLARLRRFADARWGIAALERAARLAATAGDRSLEAQAIYNRGLLRCYVGDLRRGLAEMADAVVLLEQLIATQGWVRDAEAYGPRPDGGESLADPFDWRDTYAAWLAEAGRCADVVATLALDRTTFAPPDRRLNPEAYQALGLFHAAQGRPDAAHAAFAAARAAYERAGHHFLVCISGSYELEWVMAPYQADRIAARRALSLEAEEAARRASGAEKADAPARGSSLPLLLIEGSWAELGQVAPITAQLGPGFAIYAATALGPLARAQGDTTAAWQFVRDVLPDGPATEPGGLNFARAQSLQRLAIGLALDAGDLATARAWLGAHDRWLAWSGAILGRAASVLWWATWHRAAGDATQARAKAVEATTLAETPYQPLVLLAAARLLGELTTAAGEIAEATAHLERALALADACAAPYERALTLLALVSLHHTTGDGAGARLALEEARTLCTHLGAVPVLTRIDDLAAQLATPIALDLPTPPSTRPDRLTARELEVLRLIAAGHSNVEIADQLGVSIRTIERHITNLYAKIDARGKADATAYALRHGLR